MKKLLFSLLALAFALNASAQDSPIQNLPNEKGQHIVSKCYDGEGNLHATMRYEIADYISNPAEGTDDIQIVFTMTDANGEVIDYGTIWAEYDGQRMNMRMSNRPQISDIDSYLSMNTKLMNDFMDYPDPLYSDTYADYSSFKFDGAEYTIKTGDKGSDYAKVSVYGRNIEGREEVTTPAGKFDTRKVTFDLDVYNHDTKRTETYRGTEWYADGNGIVRTEISDKNGNMVDYSEVTDTYTMR